MRNTPQRQHVPNSRWLGRVRRATLPTAGIFAVGVVLAACGGPSTPGVATGSTTTSTTTASSSTGAGTQGAGTGILAYSTCMRAHGVTTFPDPSSTGGIDNKRAVINALNAVSPAIGNAAEKSCAHVLRAGEGLGGRSTKPVTAQDQQYYLKAVTCMRAHGFPTFPDPVFSGGGVSFPITSSINTNSSKFAASRQICERLIPAGLPDSAPSGG